MWNCKKTRCRNEVFKIGPIELLDGYSWESATAVAAATAAAAVAAAPAAAVWRLSGGRAVWRAYSIAPCLSVNTNIENPLETTIEARIKSILKITKKSGPIKVSNASGVTLKKDCFV